MTAKLPYMTSTGLIPKIFEKIQNARRPERFTQDYLGTKLGHSGGSARSIIPLLKRMGFLGSDGVPTELYDQFRNPETKGFSIAEGMKKAFNTIFERNEYAHAMARPELEGLVVQITGGTKKDRRVQGVVGTFFALNELADFEAGPPINSMPEQVADLGGSDREPQGSKLPLTHSPPDNVELRLGYTINLNLPETSDPQVFNAIFKALKENLLKT